MLYAVTMDFWDPQQPYWEDKPHLPPEQLTYRDALAVYASDIPKHKVIMHKAVGILSVDGQQVKPERVTTRVTTKDFFTMFDVPFQYGGTWTDAADTGPEPVMVISRKLNETLFGGANSVGRRIRWDDNEFRIVGVRDHWMPLPTFYDVNNGALEEPEDVYIPFGWNAALELYSAGNTNGWKPEDIKTYQDFLNSESVWIQMWVELPDATARDRFQAFLDNYAQRAEAGGPLPAAAQQPPDEAGPVADGQQRRRQRRPRARRARLRFPRRVPPEHGRPAAREVPEQRPDHRRAPRARRESPAGILRSTSSKSASSPRSARCSVSRSAALLLMGLRALYTWTRRRRRHAGTRPRGHHERRDGARARVLRHHRRGTLSRLAHRPHPAGLLPEGTVT